MFSLYPEDDVQGRKDVKVCVCGGGETGMFLQLPKWKERPICTEAVSVRMKKRDQMMWAGPCQYTEMCLWNKWAGERGRGQRAQNGI